MPTHHEESEAEGKLDDNATAGELPPGETLILEWWRRSTSRNDSIVGYVFNDIHEVDPLQDGSFHRIRLDKTVNLNNLQEGSVVPTPGRSQSN